MIINFERQWVILVDDDEDDRFLVQQAFKKQDTPYLLQALTSGEELFQLLGDSPVLPAMLLLDLNMPLMNGFDVLRHLRASVTYRSIPVIMLTTSEADEDRQKAMELGAQHYVPKPTTLAGLNQVIAQLSQKWLVTR